MKKLRVSKKLKSNLDSIKCNFNLDTALRIHYDIASEIYKGHVKEESMVLRWLSPEEIAIAYLKGYKLEKECK